MARQLVAPRSLFDLVFIGEKKQKQILDAQVNALEVQAKYGAGLQRSWEDDAPELPDRVPLNPPAQPPPSSSSWKPIAEAVIGVGTLVGAGWAIWRAFK